MKTKKQKTIYNIGYQGKAQDEFIQILKSKGVTLLVDLRERPYSRIPGYNQKRLEQALKTEGIKYKHVGSVLGGFTCKRGQWQIGCELLAELSAKETIAIMCMEADVNQCHRKEIAEMLSFFHGIKNISL